MRRITANTEEFEFMVWDVMQFFYIDPTVKLGNLS